MWPRGYGCWWIRLLCSYVWLYVFVSVCVFNCCHGHKGDYLPWPQHHWRQMALPCEFLTATESIGDINLQMALNCSVTCQNIHQLVLDPKSKYTIFALLIGFLSGQFGVRGWNLGLDSHNMWYLVAAALCAGDSPSSSRMGWSKGLIYQCGESIA